jgi:hypothetical protein
LNRSAATILTGNRSGRSTAQDVFLARIPLMGAAAYLEHVTSLR